MASNDNQKKALARAIEIFESCYQAAEERFRIRQFYNNMYHNYDSILKEKRSWQTKFSHPLPFFTIETKSSFYYEGVFGQNHAGLWDVQTDIDLNYERADKITKLLRHQENRSGFVENFYYGSKDLGKFGDWFLEVFWDRDERVFQQRDEMRLSYDGEIQRPVLIRTPGELGVKVRKNQPDAKTLWINSVMPDPKATSIRDRSCRVICIRDEVTFDELKEGEENGKYINVDMLKGTQMPKISSLYYDIKPHQPYITSRNSKLRKGKSPLDEENQLVERIRLIYPKTGEVETIGNRKVHLGRSVDYPNIGHPLVHIKNYGDMSDLNGTSDFEAIANHWRLVNQYQCLEADNILMHHRGYHVMQRDAGLDVEERLRNLRPNDVLVMNNMGAVQHTRPDLFSPLVLQSKESLINQAQTPMGLNEILSGAQPSSNVRSQGQMAQLAQFGAKMMSQGIRNIGYGLRQLGEKWLMMNYENLDSDQLVSADSGGISGEELFVGPGDLSPFASVNVQLSSDLEALKEQKLQQMLQAINLGQTTGMFDTPGMIEDWFKHQGTLPDPGKYALATPDERKMVLRGQFGLGGPTAPQEPSLAGGVAPPPPNQGQINAGNLGSGVANVPSA